MRSRLRAAARAVEAFLDSYKNTAKFVMDAVGWAVKLWL